MKTKFNGILTLLLAFVVQLTFAQEKTISGTVVDETNMPLPGATVVIKGTTTGTSTDFDGKYTINANTGDVLTFSYVGYSEQDATIAASNTIDIALALDNSLEEVVVTALGVRRKQEDITYANEVVKADEITKAANANAIEALAGKVSGLQINTTGTGVNPNKDIILRGYASVTGGNNALVVIDDVVSTTNTFNNLDPNVIESVNVLKGPVGAALYGPDGGNGVIIVTTKKGAKGGKFTVDIKSALSYTEISFLPQRQDRFGQGYQGDWDWTEQTSWGPEYDGSTQVSGIPYPTSSDWRYNTYQHREDHIEDFFTTGVEDQNTVTLSAGDMEGYANFTANKVNTNGVTPNDKRTKNFFSFNGGKKVGKFSIKGIARYTSIKSNVANGNSYSDLSQSASNIDINSFSSGDARDHWTLYATSPYWNLKNRRSLANSNRFEGVLDLGYALNDNINVILRSSVNETSGNNYGYVNEFTETDPFINALADINIASAYASGSNSWRKMYTDLLTNFNYDLTENISFTGLLGYNQSETRSTAKNISGSVFTIPGFYHASNLENLDDPTETSSKFRTQAIVGSAEFGYKNYATILLTARNEWFSVISKAERSILYPSVSGSFVPTNAFPSLKGKILNKAKIYGGWTSVANVGGIGAYSINERAFGPTGFPFTNGANPAGNSFIAVSTLTDKNITPEVVETIEIGGNFDFLKVNGSSRLNLDVAYSSQTNTDQILSTVPSSTSGLVGATVNVGSTSTKAFEVDLGFTAVKTDNFEWKGRVGYSTYETIVDEVTDLSNSVTIRSSGTAGIVAQVGEAWPSIQGTTYTRDDAGRIVLDANGNPIQSNDLSILGKVAPDYTLNFNTSLKYKNVTLGATLDYRTGHSFYSGIASNYAFTGSSVESAVNGREAFLFPNSTIEGSGVTNTSVLTGGTSYADFQTYFTSNYASFDENFVLDATAVKLRELSLSYEFGTKAISQIGISRLSVGIAGRNLYTWLPKENRQYNDPEIGTGLSGYSTTPPTRSYAFSVNLSF